MSIRCRDDETEMLEVGPDCGRGNKNCDPNATAVIPAITTCLQDITSEIPNKGPYPPTIIPPDTEEEEASIVLPNELPGIESWISTDDSVFLEQISGDILTTSDLLAPIAEVKEKAIGGSRKWELIGKKTYWQFNAFPAAIPATMNGYPTIFGTLLSVNGGLVRKATNLIDYSQGFTFFMLFNNVNNLNSNATVFGAYNLSTGLANWRITSLDNIPITLYASQNLRLALEIFPTGSISNPRSTGIFTLNYPRPATDRYLMVARYDGKLGEFWINGGIPKTVSSRIYREPLVDLSYAMDYSGTETASAPTPEWVMYSRALSDVELNSIVLYYNNKYGTTFGEYFPYSESRFLYTGNGTTTFSGAASYFTGLLYITSGNITFGSTSVFKYGPGAVTKNNMFWFRTNSLAQTNGATLTQWDDFVNEQPIYGLNTFTGTGSDPTISYPGMNSLPAVDCTTGFLGSGATDYVGNRNVGELFDSATVFTISCVARTGSSLGDLWGSYMDAGTPTFYLKRYNPEDSFFIVSNPSGADPRLLIAGPSSIITGTPGNHIFTTKANLTTGVAELYVDGRLYGKTILTHTGSLPAIGTDPLAGGFIYGGAEDPWNNLVGDVVIYKEYLNSTQQQAVEDSFASTYNINVYRFPDTPAIYLDAAMLLSRSATTNTYANAVTANGHTVASIRDVIDTTKELTQTVAGFRPTASLTNGYLSFDASPDTLTGSGYGNPPTSGDCSISLLIGIPSGITFNTSTIFEWRSNSAPGLGSMLVQFGSSGRCQFQIARNDSSPTYKRYYGITSNFTFVDNNVYLIVGRFNDTAKTWDIRVNDATNLVSNGNDTTGLASLNGCRLGATEGTAFTTHFYSAMVYNRYLSSAECTTLYNYFKLRANI